MSQNIIAWSDSTVVFAILIYTLYHGFFPNIGRIAARKLRLKTFLSVLIYALIFEPIDAFTGSYYLFIISLFLGGFLYNSIVLKAGMKEVLMTGLAFIFSVICIKSISMSSVAFLMGQAGIMDQDVISVFQYGVQDILLILLSLFLIFHPLTRCDFLPSKYWAVMYIGPAVLGFLIQFHIDASGASGYLFSTDFIYMIAIALVLELILYYIAHILTKTFTDYHNANLMNQKLSLQANYMKQSETVAKQIREEKHELKNHYFYLQGLARSERYEELKDYLSSEIAERFTAMEEFHTGNDMLDYLLTQKTADARQHNIKVITNIALTPNMNIEDEDLYTLIGNLMDNAIEASKKEADPCIIIEMNVEKGFLNLSIKNRISRNVLSENPEMKTTKKNKEYHGIGLQLVKRAAEKYNGSFHMDSSGEYFTASAILQLP